MFDDRLVKTGVACVTLSIFAAGVFALAPLVVRALAATGVI